MKFFKDRCGKKYTTASHDRDWLIPFSIKADKKVQMTSAALLTVTELYSRGTEVFI